MGPKGSVAVVKYKSGILWSFSEEAPFLSVAVGDLDGDKKAEVLAGSFLGNLSCFDGRGKHLFTRNFGEGQLICSLACGDMDGRQGEEIIVGTSLKGVWALNREGRKLWRLKPREVWIRTPGGRKKNRQKSGRRPHNKLENVQTLHVADLNMDGKNEVVVGARPSGMVLVLRNDGTELWRRSFPETMDITTSASTVVGDFTEDPGNEIFAFLTGTGVSGHRGSGLGALLSSSGSTLYLAETKTQFFSLTSLHSGADGPDRVVLSSAVRGKGVNVLSFHVGAGRDLFSKYRDNVQQEVEHRLERIRPPQGSPNAKASQKRQFHFLFRVDYRDLFRKDQASVDAFLKEVWRVPGENAVVLTGFKEDLRLVLRGDWKAGAKLGREQILEIVRWFEARRIPFYLNIGKHAMLFFRVETLGDVLESGKNYCQGFLMDEDNYTRTEHWKTLLAQLDRLLGVMVRYPGKKLVMNEYRAFWHRFLLVDEHFDILFKREYRKIVVPIYKPNNIKAPELNLAVLAGLWQEGIVDDWGVGAYADTWKWGHVFLGAPGDIHLRLFLMAASLGGNYFVIAKNLTWNQGYLGPDPDYRPYFEALFRLVDAGVVTPVQSPQDAFLSPLSRWEMADQAEIKMRTTGTKIYWQRIFQMRGWHDTGFFLQAAREDYLSRQIYGGKDYHAMLFPSTPYGFVTLRPFVKALASRVPERHWIVQGQALYLVDKGRRERLSSARPLLDELKITASTLPARATGAYCSSVRRPGGYLIYLINPFVFESKPVRTTLNVRTGEEELLFRDAISGEPLAQKNGQIEVDVPESLFRLITADTMHE
jgi:hypothetical protein